MRWGLVIGLLIVFGVVGGMTYFLFLSGDPLDSSLNSKPVLEEASPGIVSTSPNKLSDISPKIDEEGVEEAKLLRVLAYSESDNVELLSLARSGDYWNINETLGEVFSSRILERNLKDFLRKGTVENTKEIILYEQRIDFNDSLKLIDFIDEDYLGTKETYYGWVMGDSSNVLNYTINFVKDIQWSQLEGTTIFFMGRKYYVFDVVETLEMSMYKSPLEFSLKEGQRVRLAHQDFLIKEVEISRINSEEVILDINNAKTSKLRARDYFQYQDFYLYVKEIAHSEDKASVATLIASPNILKVSEDGIFLDGKPHEDLEASFYPSSGGYIKRIDVIWKVDRKKFITPADPLKMPVFENLRFTAKKLDYEPDSYDPFINLSLEAKTFSSQISESSIPIS